MKELSIEQKAKLYDEAKLRISAAYNSNRCTIGFMNEIFPELKESEDDRIRQFLIHEITETSDEILSYRNMNKKDVLSWLERQGKNNMGISEATKQKLEDNLNKALEKETPESLNEFLDEQKPVEEYNITGIGSKHAQGKLGEMIKNLKPVDEVLEHNPADKVEPKFKVGDWVIDKQGIVHQIANVIENVTYHTYGYDVVGGGYFNDNTEGIRLWTIQDAKDGDVLFTSSTASHETFIFKSIDEKGNVECYFAYDSEDGFCEGKYHFIGRAKDCKPATKEQCDLLFQKMKEAGYKWDAENKQLKKIEQKPAEWSDEDELKRSTLVDVVKKQQGSAIFEGLLPDELIDWLKSLKERIQPQNTWKPSDEQMEALEHFVRSIGESGYASSYDNNTKLLYSLLSDFKKLKA